MKATVGVGFQPTETLTVSGKLKVLSVLNSDDREVTAHIPVEQYNFTVQNPGVGNTLLGLDATVNYQPQKNWTVSATAGVSGENSLDGDFGSELKVNYSF